MPPGCQCQNVADLPNPSSFILFMDVSESGIKPNVRFKLFRKAEDGTCKMDAASTFPGMLREGHPRNKHWKGKAANHESGSYMWQSSAIVRLWDHIRSVSLHCFAPEDCPNLDALYSVGLPKWTWAFTLSMSIWWSQDFTKRTSLMLIECPASRWLKQNPHEIVVHLKAK